jgi:hypothetical protein
VTFYASSQRARFIIVSVDWEKDSSIWKSARAQNDYGGIIRATGPLLELLRELDAPASFLVECHARYPEHNLPTLFPDIVKGLVASKHEVGIHIHWARRDGAAWTYPVNEECWISTLVQNARETMSAMGVEHPPFRGGAFLHVPNLPRVLRQNGMTIDSTLYRGIAYGFPRTRLELVRTLLSYLSASPRPYLCSDGDNRLSGASGVLEFPVSFSLFSLLRHRTLRWKFLRALRDSSNRFYVLYFHIHELTRPDSGPGEQAETDTRAIEGVRNLLCYLKRSRQAEFITFNQAKLLLQENGVS